MVMARVKEVRASANVTQPADLQARVADFIRENELDQRCADLMRGLMASDAEAVLADGPVAGTEKPSAAVMGRMARISKQKKAP